MTRSEGHAGVAVFANFVRNHFDGSRRRKYHLAHPSLTTRPGSQDSLGTFKKRRLSDGQSSSRLSIRPTAYFERNIENILYANAIPRVSPFDQIWEFHLQRYAGQFTSTSHVISRNRAQSLPRSTTSMLRSHISAWDLSDLCHTKERERTLPRRPSSNKDARHPTPGFGTRGSEVQTLSPRPMFSIVYRLFSILHFCHCRQFCSCESLRDQ